jgi:hypothetical protein
MGGAVKGWPGGPWLTTAEYKAWARIDATDVADDAAIAEAVDASQEAIELRAPAAFTVDPDTEAPDPVPKMVHQAGLLLTNRLMSRRNSPDGVVGVSDMGTATVLSYDADITQLLAPWTEMVVG